MTDLDLILVVAKSWAIFVFAVCCGTIAGIIADDWVARRVVRRGR